MKKCILFISLIVFLSASVYAQEKKLQSKVNLVGAGYGLEYFASPKFSFHNEIGLSYWGKISDKIQGEEIYSDLAALNPYFISSVRFYFVPMHPAKNENISIGWRISTTYTGEFTLNNDIKFSGHNSHKLGLFAGTTIHFSKKTYFELELGPGYDFGNLNDYKFNLLGNMGFGFTF
jgi:putative salt-induced outer membrane protein YdiY